MLAKPTSRNLNLGSDRFSMFNKERDNPPYYAYAYRPAYVYRPWRYAYVHRPYYVYRPYRYAYVYRPYYAYRPYAYGAYAYAGFGPRLWVGWRRHWW